MMIHKIYYILLLLILLSACSAENPLHEDGVTDYGFITRANENALYSPSECLTYRLLTYKDDDYSFNNTASGTFSGIPGEIMKPTKLNSDGSIDSVATSDEHAASILDGVYGKRWLLCISPGYMHEQNGSIGFKPADVRNGKLLAAANIQQLGLLKLYEIDTLRDIRSRLTFRISIHPTAKGHIHSINVTDFQVKGVGASDETIYTLPAQRQIITPRQVRSVTLTDMSTDDEPKSVFATDVPEYVASAIYAPRDVAIDILNLSERFSGYVQESDYISASFKLSQNGGNPLEMNFVLNKVNEISELLPMHEYAFNFNVKSTTVDLVLDVFSYVGQNSHNWYKMDLSDAEISDIFPKLSIKVGEWPITDWNTEELENPEI